MTAMPPSIPQQPSSPPASSGTAASAGWLGTAGRLTDPRHSQGTIPPAGIDLNQPRQGITLAGHDGSSASSLLGLDLRPAYRLTDHWLRGDDVTAIYECADDRHLRTTAMWRLHPSMAGIRAWELVVSAQTSLLQSDSMLAVVSDIDATAILWGTCQDGAVQWQSVPSPEATYVLLTHGSTPDSRTSVLVAAHPSDARRVTATQHGRRTSIECWLFSTELEKGVLLRSRVLAAIGPAATATHWAGELAAAFAASPPLLTT